MNSRVIGPSSLCLLRLAAAFWVSGRGFSHHLLLDPSIGVPETAFGTSGMQRTSSTTVQEPPHKLLWSVLSQKHLLLSSAESPLLETSCSPLRRQWGICWQSFDGLLCCACGSETSQELCVPERKGCCAVQLPEGVCCAFPLASFCQSRGSNGEKCRLSQPIAKHKTSLNNCSLIHSLTAGFLFLIFPGFRKLHSGAYPHFATVGWFGKIFLFILCLHRRQEILLLLRSSQNR